MASVLITGASRGLGLEYARQYLADGWLVHACCRAPQAAGELQVLAREGNLTIHRMDVTNPDEIASLAHILRDTPLDILINNAGIIDNYGFGVADGRDDPDIRNCDFDIWRQILETNLMAPARITGAFVDNLARPRCSTGPEHRIVVMMTSALGSIASTELGGRYAYRTSKAGLNMLTRGLAAWLQPKGITVAAIAPGWTRTQMGGANAPVGIAQSVSGMRRVIAGLTPAHSGTFWNWDGEHIAW